ncbi:methionyl-tRNA formyltransferase [Halorarum halophilum]|uniref:Methionyl-tRNA formyltransferase n=1 Tax=Halorarum halophilum TaxID=2743090 RepID=A0A7D5GG35_9EURY|nr:formyltransferase family protein [Halobaculum halophilum]QLG28748.1 methionyl-tRNA formyltransferase [Halobaculum halophilum]
MSEAPPNNLCVLADPYLKGYQVRSMEIAVERAGVEIPLVLVNDDEDPDYDREAEAKTVNEGLGLDAVRLFFDVLERERAWTFVIAEKKLAEEFGTRVEPSRRIHVDDIALFDDADVRRVSPVKDGNWNELPPDAVEAVGESCDVGMRYGFGLLKGDVLEVPEYGVLSFHPADIRLYRGMGPPQAYLDGRDRMGVTLQRLTEDIDAGEIIAYAETDVDDGATLWEIYDELHDLQANTLATGIENLRDPSIEPTVPDSLGPYYSTTLRRKPSFAGRVLLKNLRGHVLS